MFLNILSLLALWALDYWTLYVLPKKASRVVIILGCLVVFVALSEANKRVHASSTSFSLLISQLLGLGGLVAGLGFMNQASQFIVTRVKQFHRETNAENLHRFPVSLFDQHEEGIKKAITGFWFVTSLFIIFSTIFMAHQ